MNDVINNHLNEMQERPDMLETINLRVLQDLLKDGRITSSQLKKFEKIASDKGNEHVITYFNDFDNRMNDHGFSPDHMRNVIVGLLKNKGYKLDSILGESTYTALKHSVLDFLYELINRVQGQTDGIVQKTEKHTKKMNTAKTKEKKEKEVKIDDLKEKLNEGTGPQKLEDMLPFLKPTKEEVEYNNQFRKAVDLMSNPKKMMEAIELSKGLKKPEARKDFTEAQQKDFFNARAKIVEQLGYEVLTNKEKYLTLEKDGYVVQMKHFMLPSGSGYSNGRISEIEISKGKIYSLWANGWDKNPKDEGVNKIFDELVNYIN